MKVQELQNFIPTPGGKQATCQDIATVPERQNVIPAPNDKQATCQAIAIFPEEQTILDNFAQQPNPNLATWPKTPPIAQTLQTLQATALNQSLQTPAYQAIQTRIQQLGHRQTIALLYPLIRDNAPPRLLVLRPGQAPILRTPTDPICTQLAPVLDQFNKTITDHTSWDIQTPAQTLHNCLIAPIQADLQGVDTLVYAPDGRMRNIAIAALYDSAQPPGKRWLAQRYRINYLTALANTNTNTTPQPPLQPKILIGAVADTRRQIPVTLTPSAKSLPKPATSTTPSTLSGLAAAKPEAEFLHRTFPSLVLWDQALTFANLKTHIAHYNTLHLATHAAFFPNDPDRSFILMGDGPALSLSDLAQWSTPNLSLLVLAACESAIGTTDSKSTGLEILGFGYHAQLNGVRTSLASLWDVNDQGTQTLMKSFYTALKAQQTTPSEALYQAQLAMMANTEPPKPDQRNRGTVFSNRPAAAPATSKGKSHPYFWAPFILIGNGL